MNTVNIQDIEKVEHFRSKLKCFYEETIRHLESSNQTIKRMKHWIELDRIPFWKGEVKRRYEKMITTKNDYVNAKFRMKDTHNTPMYEKKRYEQSVKSHSDAVQKLKCAKYRASSFEKDISESYLVIKQLQNLVTQDEVQSIKLLHHQLEQLKRYLS